MCAGCALHRACPVFLRVILLGMPLKLSKTVLQDYAKASKLEWIETNGLGGFASETVLGSHNWRYHGLLFASFKPPTHRALLLSRIEESIIINDERFELSTNQYDGTVHPEGYTYLTSFTLDPFPIWEYTIGKIKLKKTIFMTHGKNEVSVMFELISAPAKTSIQLHLKPIVAFRDLHKTTQENQLFNAEILEKPECLVIRPYEEFPPMSLFSNSINFSIDGRSWYKRFYYEREVERGHDAFEDLFAIGDLTFDLAKTKPAFLTANTEIGGKMTLTQVKTAMKKEKSRRDKLVKKTDSELIKVLKRAADQFIVQRDGKATIIAGYPWFADWGRDSFISLPGLLLTTERYDEAREVILNFLERMQQGIIPNTFPEKNEAPLYNTVDASLWLIHAVDQLILKTKDTKFLMKVFPMLRQIIDSYEKGTFNGIQMDPNDFLITQGADGLALTWMDAVVDGHVVTPRRGKAVEINALWYRALRSMHRMAKRIGAREVSEIYEGLADNVRESFTKTFWNEEQQCLFDCVDPSGGKIAEIRPNQIFAVKLSDDLLMPEHRFAVVNTVREKLLTPVGLRSLSSDHPDYRKNYQGNLFERDSAYHQGTVWGFLMEPYVGALFHAFGDSFKTKKEARMLLKNMEPHLLDACIGQGSEIFDAEAPFAPRGCPAQAWTIAAMLQIADELRQSF